MALRHAGLSWKARGLLGFLLSMPDNWRTNTSHLTRCAPDGRDSVKAALRELEQAGYLRREKTRTAGGRWSWDIKVFDHPQTVHNSGDNPSTIDGFSGDGFPVDIRSTYQEVLTNSVTRNSKSESTDLWICADCNATGRTPTGDECTCEPLL